MRPLQINTMAINARKKIFGGFTLIELIVVVVIIAISAAIALPIYDKTVDDAQKRHAWSQLKIIRGAELVYKETHNHFHGFATLDNNARDTLAITVNDNSDWQYTVGANAGMATAASAAVTAKRMAGKHINELLWMSVSSTATAAYTW